jgi:hypothetical protein
MLSVCHWCHSVSLAAVIGKFNCCWSLLSQIYVARTVIFCFFVCYLMQFSYSCETYGSCSSLTTPLLPFSCPCNILIILSVIILASVNIGASVSPSFSCLIVYTFLGLFSVMSFELYSKLVGCGGDPVAMHLHLLALQCGLKSHCRQVVYVHRRSTDSKFPVTSDHTHVSHWITTRSPWLALQEEGTHVAVS